MPISLIIFSNPSVPSLLLGAKLCCKKPKHALKAIFRQVPAVGLFSGVIPMKEEWSGWFRFSWGILGSFSNGLSSLRPNLTLLGRMKQPLCRRIRSAEV